MRQIKSVEPWDENTNIDWQRKCRKRLNKVISKFNKWQVEKNFDVYYGMKVLRHIEAEKQGVGSRDGGSGYLEVLLDMEQFVKDNLVECCPHCGALI
jgi:hypothetical protein